MNKRIERLQRLLKRIRLGALLVSSPSNIFYLSGFSSSDSYLLITPSKNYIITDFRYEEQARNETTGFEVVSQPASLFEKTARLIKKLSIKRIGFESAHLTVKEKELISRDAKSRLCPTFELIEQLRVVKEPQELVIIRKAANIARLVYKKISTEIKEGRRESDIAARIDFLLKTSGADGASFETIVSSGKNSSMPHARPSHKPIKASEPVILDFGARLLGYNSDLTRTFFVGRIDKPSNIIYSIVRTAQQKAIDKVTCGARISDIDRAAREYISKKGFAKHFGHATGHCIGIDVHEPPSISSKNHTRLKEGMVFSVEPAIYLPGWGGVRIEDMVAVTEKGCEVLTV